MRHHFHHHHREGHDREGFLFVGRHRHGRGFGPFGGGPFGAGPFGGGEDFRTGRKLAAGDLQLLILALLADKPSHGYELIKLLDEKSRGFYVPSPGMVYPALTYLEEIGHATVEADGAKKRYHITEEGRAHLKENQETVDTMLDRLEQIGQRMEKVREAFSGEEEDERGFRGQGFREILAAKRELKMAMHEKKRSGPEEIKRIAEILLRAAREIRGQ